MVVQTFSSTNSIKMISFHAVLRADEAKQSKAKQTNAFVFCC